MRVETIKNTIIISDHIATNERNLVNKMLEDLKKEGWIVVEEEITQGKSLIHRRLTKLDPHRITVQLIFESDFAMNEDDIKKAVSGVKKCTVKILESMQI